MIYYISTDQSSLSELRTGLLIIFDNRNPDLYLKLALCSYMNHVRQNWLHVRTVRINIFF